MSDQYTGVLSPYLMRRRVAVARPHIRGRVLDVGCAAGVLAVYVSTDDYVGVDIDDTVLEDARRSHPAHVFCRPEHIDATERFDTVVALAVIEHMHDARDWADRMRALVRPGGSVVVTTPHRRWDFIHDIAARIGLASHEAADEHHEMFDRSSLTTLLEQTGLQVICYRRFLLGMNQLVIAQRPVGAER
jgi:2-polyprenyl-3-methyl-5-hydroxy-6-metoxy-1,4-benzoquinol methylase